MLGGLVETADSDAREQQHLSEGEMVKIGSLNRLPNWECVFDI